MSTITAPVAVRIFNNWGQNFDEWIPRKDLTSLSYTTGIPGGYLNANIGIKHNRSRNAERLFRIFNQLKVVDIRSAETVWEGRISDPRRTADGWELGCAGPVDLATDIRRPIFYIDSLIDNWRTPGGATSEWFKVKTDSDTNSGSFSQSVGSNTGPNHLPIMWWDKTWAADVYLGRFDITYDGTAGNSGNRTAIDVIAAGGGVQQNVDLQAWNGAVIRRVNKVGTDFTATDAQTLQVAIDLASGTWTTQETDFGSIVKPSIQIQRQDRYGNWLNTAASYPNSFLRVGDIIEDVVGRFLVGRWMRTDGPPFGVPFTGRVNPDRVYIDTSSAAKITHMTFYDGVTAAEIFDELIETAQPNAYWAFWASDWRTNVNDTNTAGHQFEWATWPNSWGYSASLADGVFEEQPNGGEAFNYIHYNYEWEDSPGVRSQTWWYTRGTEFQHPDLANAGIARGTYARRDVLSQSGESNSDLAQAELKKYVVPKSTAKMTIHRPIHLYSSGEYGSTGACRMVDPAAIRAGKLIRIFDVVPKANTGKFAVGDANNPREHEAVVYRVINTKFDAVKNTCELELDLPLEFDVASQIARSPVKAKQTLSRL